MRIKQLQLKNFRCFATLTLDMDYPIILLEGPNGSGKTSLLEAMHYLCYVRSFRTHVPRDLAYEQESSFFIKAHLSQDAVDHELQIGFSGKKRLVKLDQRPIQSLKELMSFYRVVTLTEDDLTLIKGGPDGRRTFLDTACILFDPESVVQLRTFKTIVENRNALFLRGRPSPESYLLWTQQLWQLSSEIQHARIAVLQSLEGRVNLLLANYFNDRPLNVRLGYQEKNSDTAQSFEQFLARTQGFYEEEVRMRRSLFGAHLDDFTIDFCHKSSKAYASRGQQKLVMVLLKVALMLEIGERKGPSIFLLDDFLTDFDEPTVQTLLRLLTSMQSQLIFTSPAQSDGNDRLIASGAHRIKLTHRIV